MFVAHGADRNLDAGVFECPCQRILDDGEFRSGMLLRKTPDFAVARDGWFVVEVHLRRKVNVLALQFRWDYDAGFRIVAESC